MSTFVTRIALHSGLTGSQNSPNNGSTSVISSNFNKRPISGPASANENEKEYYPASHLAFIKNVVTLLYLISIVYPEWY